MKWGLVLAGGGTRGAYHVGVCRAIKKLGLDIECVTGTSIGAVNGALFVQDDLPLAQALWEHIRVCDVFDFGNKVISHNNLLDRHSLVCVADEIIKKNYLNTKPFDKLVSSVVSEDKIRQSGIDFGLSVISLDDRCERNCFVADIPGGELVNYVLASACFAGFKPRKIRRSRYVDAGLVNNMPTDMILARGLKNIIEVDVGGWGHKKQICRTDKNIISIRADEPEVGMFEFEGDKLSRSIKLGYLDTLKAFGVLCGEKYYFDTKDYFAAQKRYSEHILEGIECAAHILNIDRLRIYSVKELSENVKRAVESKAVQKNITKKQMELIKRLRHLRCSGINIYGASNGRNRAALGAGAIIYLQSQDSD